MLPPRIVASDGWSNLMILVFELKSNQDPYPWLKEIYDRYPDCVTHYERAVNGHPHVCRVYPELKRAPREHPLGGEVQTD